jgi:hypothetical protein
MFLMVPFKALNLSIQESYDSKREDMFKVAEYPGLTLSVLVPSRLGGENKK